MPHYNVEKPGESMSSKRLAVLFGWLLVVFSSASSAEAEEVVTYEAFGAAGDGVHDDLPAIREAHESANSQGLPVKTKPTATASFFVETGRSRATSTGTTTMSVLSKPAHWMKSRLSCGARRRTDSATRLRSRVARRNNRLV